MGELNLDKIERNYRNDTDMELFQFLPDKPEPIRLAGWKSSVDKDRFRLSGEKSAARSAIHL